MRTTLKTPRAVALCTGAAPFSENKILRRETAEKYPGALWIPELVDKLTRHGITTITGDVALRQVKTGDLNPSEVWLIQEDRSFEGDELLRLGAKGKVLLCCESPLFAADFYHNLSSISRKFEYGLVFRGAINDAFPLIAANALYFPSFDPAKSCQSLSWDSRKYLVMVAGNKYWKIRRSPIRQLAAKIRDVVSRSPQRISRAYASTQLHDHRLAAISHFGQWDKLDLYGSGWGSLKNLPLHWQNELSVTISKLNPAPCTDKLATIARYRFALCFENLEFPGYVTEKIIDCLVAGVVPIYWGAPDIRDFIPEDCFIDSRKFESLGDLDSYLGRISELEWQKIVSCGNSFLNSAMGQRYSYREFAGQMEAMLIG
jgi:hypothetical protein